MIDRPILQLLPGNMCDDRVWDGLRSSLEDWTILTPTLTEDCSIDAMAARCLAMTTGPIIPVGLSMGGIVALAMADLAPERMVGLALLDTNPGADLPERAALRPGQQEQVRKGDLERIVIEELKPNYLAAASRSDMALRELLRDMALRLGVGVFVRQSEALRLRPDRWSVLQRIDVPVFIACGAEDALCPPAWHQAMAAEARQSELHIIAGAGHMLPLEQPVRLAELLGSWLAALMGEQTCPIAS